MRNVRVAVWGFGAMGGGVAKVLLGKRGVDVVGVCDIHPARVNRSMFEVLGVERGERADVMIEPDIERALAGKPDVCVLATDSFTKKAFPKIRAIVQRGVNVICTAEQMSYPAANEPELTREMDRLAKENGVSILGTGINPGLMMDLLAVCLSGCMTDVRRVACRRVNSLSPFGPAVMEEQGIGITLEEFEHGVSDGTLAGHVGFAESVGMISDALGLGIDRFEQQMRPIVTVVDRRSPHGFAAAGRVAGVNMTGQGYRSGEVVVDLVHPQQIEPQLGGTETGDYIALSGTPNVNMSIRPEVDGGVGTIAMCVNMIPHVINARPGLRTMLDLPVPRAIMGDFRDSIEEELQG